MDHETLIAEHAAIDAVTQVLLALTRNVPAQPAEACGVLSALAGLVHDHLVHEDPVIYQTVEAARDTRHGLVAALSAVSFDHLKRDWTQYLYRWNEAAVAADWNGFASVSQSMLERLRDRVARETAILYSLAQHYAVIDGGDASAA